MTTESNNHLQMRADLLKLYRFDSLFCNRLFAEQVVVNDQFSVSPKICCVCVLRSVFVSCVLCSVS